MLLLGLIIRLLRVTGAPRNVHWVLLTVRGTALNWETHTEGDNAMLELNHYEVLVKTGDLLLKTIEEITRKLAYKSCVCAEK